MSKTVGFIVEGDWGAKSLDNDWVPEGCYKGVLTNNTPATLFKTRARAQGAIDRTKKYIEQEGLGNWSAWSGLKIVRVEEETL